jgi:hypothetical protein
VEALQVIAAELRNETKARSVARQIGQRHRHRRQRRRDGAGHEPERAGLQARIYLTFKLFMSKVAPGFQQEARSMGTHCADTGPVQTRRTVDGFELRFESVRRGGRPYAFPCDRAGRVDLDRLEEPMRNDYFFARGVTGREFHSPSVRACTTH